ncbi:hypothetical protein HZS_6937, partial [Henneguya salminicola]
MVGKALLSKKDPNGDYVSLSYNSSTIEWNINFQQTRRIFHSSVSMDIEELKVKKWIHISVTYNSIFGSSNIYKNGRLVKSSYVDGEKFNGDLWIKGIYSLWAPNINESIHGKLDELYIINSALSSTEVNDLMGVCNVGIDFGIPSDKVTQIMEKEKNVKIDKNYKKAHENLKCQKKNIENFLSNSDLEHFRTIESKFLSFENCFNECCSITECNGYLYEDKYCRLFTNITESFLKKPDKNLCKLNKRKEKAIFGATEGQWNVIFISISPDFNSCAESVCNEESYELIRFDQDSHNCFGIYCTNPRECRIRKDSSKRSMIFSINNNNSYGNIFNVLIEMISDYEKTNKTEKNIEFLDQLDNIFTPQKCELNFIVEKAKPSKTLLINSIISQHNIKSNDECVDLCCNEDSCNLAFITDGHCVLIKCPLESNCFAHQKESYNKSNKVIYIKRAGNTLFSSKKEAIIKEKDTKINMRCKNKIYSHAMFDFAQKSRDILNVLNNLHSYKKCNSFYLDFIGITPLPNNVFTTKHEREDNMMGQSSIRDAFNQHPIKQSHKYIHHLPETYESNKIDYWTMNCVLRQNLCSQICIPVLDSYTCACEEGYELLDDGITCRASYSFMFVLISWPAAWERLTTGIFCAAVLPFPGTSAEFSSCRLRQALGDVLREEWSFATRTKATYDKAE